MFKKEGINSDYKCWLKYYEIEDEYLGRYKKWLENIIVPKNKGGTDSAEEEIVKSIIAELKTGFYKLIGEKVVPHSGDPACSGFILADILDSRDLIREGLTVQEREEINRDGFLIKHYDSGPKEGLVITAKTYRGLLYGVFHFFRLLQEKRELRKLNLLENPDNKLRIINHWDNLDGSIERGYAGKSIFYENNELKENEDRWHDYARLLGSVGINGIVINNVNVSRAASDLLDDKLNMVEKLNTVFRKYGLKVYISINFASPCEDDEIGTADPLKESVQNWWKKKVNNIYNRIPDFGGFLVKADSEGRPGPFTYDRSHAEGANMLARILKSHGGVLIWRCFVYDCQQDWRDYSTDRARAAYDNFMPLDGEFEDNVLLQIKNGPMDFQVREPVSPLLGAMKQTNQLLELQITQEYTGQQIHVCYLVPQWKEILEFDTRARGETSRVKRVVDGSVHDFSLSGMVGVGNVGSDMNWTGHTLAQANLFGFARLAWDPDLSAEKITRRWCRYTLGEDREVNAKTAQILLKSWETYEKYTAPLGVGWMVNPGHHYGPNVDGYEYSRWGTYHRADIHGIGVDRTVKTGTGFTEQYFAAKKELYEDPETCPDELLLFFHHLPYIYKLDSGKTIIQHIYDTHFEGVEQVKEFIDIWSQLSDELEPAIFKNVQKRLKQQLESAREWRDVINTYFYRKTGFPDEKHRKIYK